MAVDYSPYQQYLDYAGRSGDILGALTLQGGPEEMQFSGVDQGWMADPTSIFDVGYNQGNRRSLNPYFTTQNRDALREVATKLGLTGEDADKAALDYAQHHLGTTGSGYTDATHPALVANEIARSLFKQAGQPYQEMDQGKANMLLEQAKGFQQRNKLSDQDAWKRDDLGGIFGVWGEQIQNKFEGDTKDPIRAIAGFDNPINTKIGNTLLNKDWDPYGNEYGMPTKGNYQQAQSQGYDTNAAAFIQQVLQMAAASYLGATGATGELAGLSGIDPSYVKAAGAASKVQQGYENDNPLGALSGVGSLYAGLNTGTLTDAAPAGTSAGTTGGGMWDEDGNFIDPNANAYNDPQYEGGYDTTADGNANYNYNIDPYEQSQGGGFNLGSISGLLGNSQLGNLLKGVLGGGSTGGTGTTGTGGIDLSRILGALGGTAAGVLGSKNVANKYDSMANRYEGYGAPYRDQLAQLYSNPDSFLNSNAVQAPVQQGTNALARALSVRGNPAGSNTSMQEIQDYSANQLFGRLGEEKNRLASLSGIPQYAAAAPGAASKAADAYGGQYGAVGSGIADLTTPKTDLATMLKQLGLA